MLSKGPVFDIDIHFPASIFPLVQYIACNDRNTISQHGSMQRTRNLINGRLISHEWFQLHYIQWNFHSNQLFKAYNGIFRCWCMCVYIYDQCCKCVDWNSILFIHIKWGLERPQWSKYPWISVGNLQRNWWKPQTLFLYEGRRSEFN